MALTEAFRESPDASPYPPASTDIEGLTWPARWPIQAPPEERLVIALVGLSFEANIAAGPGVFVICRDSESEIATLFEAALKKGCRSIISFGVAGGLAPHLRAGDWIVASSIIDAQHVRPTSPSWSQKMLELIPGAGHAPIVGVDAAVTDTTAKRRMHVQTGAAAVDMESHLVARFAAMHGLSFAAARVVIDPAHRFVPAAALAGMRPGGGTNVTAVIRELIARPRQLFDVIRVAFDAYAARSAMLRARRALGPGFAVAIAAPSELTAQTAAPHVALRPTPGIQVSPAGSALNF